MATQHETTDVEQGTQATRGMQGRAGRRGLIAGAAALAAGLLAKQGAQPVSANTNMQALIIATGNTASTTTTLVALNTFNQVAGAFVAAFDAAPAPGGGQSIAGVVGYGGGDNGNGVMGGSKGVSFQSFLGDFNSNAGVLGRANSGNIGVYGISPQGYGVFGASTDATGSSGSSTNSYGIYGSSTNNYGILGVTGATGGDFGGVLGFGNGNGTHGVRGTNTGAGAGVTGAVTGSGSGTGVKGTSQTGIGVYGISGGGASPFGVVGTVQSAPGFALYGVASVSGTVGFNAGASVAGAIAGQFCGPVNIYNVPASGTPITTGDLYVQRNFQVSGTKSAAVPHPDGTHRLLYCVESPEAWFEDFGEGTITAGKAEVRLDPDFAAVVDTKDAACVHHRT